jgi:hypothetical protein
LDLSPRFGDEVGVAVTDEDPDAEDVALTWLLS